MAPFLWAYKPSVPTWNIRICCVWLFLCKFWGPVNRQKLVLSLHLPTLFGPKPPAAEGPAKRTSAAFKTLSHSLMVRNFKGKLLSWRQGDGVASSLDWLVFIGSPIRPNWIVRISKKFDSLTHPTIGHQPAGVLNIEHVVSNMWFKKPYN